MNYTVIETDSLHELISWTNHLIRTEGYKPLAGIFVLRGPNAIEYYQSLVKE